ncbi:hypothetical protein K438DRAFT_1838137 [Mycena galopus ATCC 62051]|nr:hypothetical protein K438DRAFT_1838137 [Mycena galopus ATCC 62051]
MAASCLIAVGGTTQMGLTIVQAVLATRSFQELLRSPELNHDCFARTILTAQGLVAVINNFVTDSFFSYRCYVIWGFQRKMLLLPSLFMVATLVAGIRAATSLDITDQQIVYGLGAATNLILTVLTVGRLMWIRRAASCVGLNNSFHIRCNRAINLMLESGAIYCIAAILTLVTVSVDDLEVYVIELGFLSHLLNIIPTFSLVYVGLNTPADQDHPKGNPNASSTQRIAPRADATQPWEPTQVLDIKPPGMMKTDDEYV